LALIREPLDVMVVVGGYNSSNTCHLAALVQQNGIPAFHIEDADAIDVERGSIRHQPIGTKSEAVTERWLGEARIIGITAGASTPNNKVGETIARISAVAGMDAELETALQNKA
jgi:4-hydroxy-3-methylbut-2-enyl diphosphate reductase